MEQDAPASIVGSVTRVDGEWKVVGLLKSGRVQNTGKFPFTCRYSAMEGFDVDDLGQEMAVHDPRNERIFYDFNFSRREPPPKAMKEMIETMQRKVHAAVRGR